MATLEESLEKLPDEVANALETWRKETLELERLDAMLYLKFKASDVKRTSDEIKAMIKTDGNRYSLALSEIQAEITYNRLYERLLSAKKLAALRTAY